MRETFPKNIAVESSLPTTLWPLNGDSTQLHQVLLNLCVNARDAMPGGGRLQLNARDLEVDANYASMLPEATPGRYVLLEVTDTGTGIPPDVIERIFDPFFTTKDVGKGTGLGLSTVHGIVKNHGGFVKVLTESGKGTTFQVFLPALTAVDGPAEPGSPQSEIPAGHGELVLVVDDEKDVRTAARTALEAFGYEVLVAENGTEGLGIFATNSKRVALVLTDLMMPFMDGVAMTRALRRMAPDLPIIASSGLGEKAKLAELRAMKVSHILTKPYTAYRLLRSIHDALKPELHAPETNNT